MTDAGSAQPGRVSAGGVHPGDGEGMHHQPSERSIEEAIVARVPALAPAFRATNQALAVVSGVALLVLSFVLLGRFVVPWAGGASAAKAVAHIEARANSVLEAIANVAMSSSGPSGVPNGRADDEGSTMLRRVGGNMAGSGMLELQRPVPSLHRPHTSAMSRVFLRDGPRLRCDRRGGSSILSVMLSEAQAQ
ncbi:MAG: hypothetical protein U5M23_15260 [Marinagarivorans sp.]|nr:hypothetical protein [Marinagarivorans sp.]